MLILLPPSETKTRPHAPDAPTLELSSMAFPELTESRREMIAAAGRTARGDVAMEKLKIPASQPELRERMAHLENEPVATPLEVYSGVLFDALGQPSVSDGCRLLAASALFGIVDCHADAIPAYRLSAGSEVEGLGKVAAWWKPRLKHIAEAIEESGEIVIDCRSGAYRSMMPLKGAQVLEVSPVAVREGKRRVISHDAKRYRGLVARALCEATSPAETADDVLEILMNGLGDSLGFELSSGKARSTLTVVDDWERH
ncbi:Protein of uncharacterised function (DUF328) [Mycobacteroides abscessus subsp. abscessus]|uniref:YaaA family protein n=1 Tax=Dermabacter sp. HSID17554 TaxID=2419511 RepID=UPI00092A6FFC|nr:peroxide stress protein YaaA [Dermabacter sp. HSID17554]RUP87141.1 peroxide stress protein YaaA [Dermabacter sp. HSID17554]SHV75061.1 Protein of uncharacterised function (DUF328) [Mycobacteroides abscessus subsp. abscessus]